MDTFLVGFKESMMERARLGPSVRDGGEGPELVRVSVPAGWSHTGALVRPSYRPLS